MFKFLEVVSLQRDLLGILFLVPRVQGPSWFVDLLLYLAGMAQLAFSWWALQNLYLAPALRVLSWLLQKVGRLLSCVQILSYLEYCLVW